MKPNYIQNTESFILINLFVLITALCIPTVSQATLLNYVYNGPEFTYTRTPSNYSTMDYLTVSFTHDFGEGAGSVSYQGSGNTQPIPFTMAVVTPTGPIDIISPWDANLLNYYFRMSWNDLGTPTEWYIKASLDLSPDDPWAPMGVPAQLSLDIRWDIDYQHGHPEGSPIAWSDGVWVADDWSGVVDEAYVFRQGEWVTTPAIPTPEPATILLIGSGFVGLYVRRRKL